ncbi:hypothetical protein [Propioniciclava soli]|uniref:Uncharacterized protein n=1 Tax=Propioniciclava soli TaxID=2775081 RepID=A0ABZ3C7V2_9ACTN|nr:hypothetical protein [Propioniciclava soli]
MPETRKHHPVARDDLDRAIQAALGENPRPFTPGEDPTAPPPGSEPEAFRPGHLPPTSALGSFTFAPLESPTGAAAAKDDPAT